MNLLNVVVYGIFGFWGLFMAGTLLVVVVMKITPDEGRAYVDVNGRVSYLSTHQCGPSRARTYTRPVTEMKPAKPETTTTPVRPEPARVVQPEHEPAYLVKNWPIRKPPDPIERN
jgi:hypothetical protein